MLIPQIDPLLINKIQLDMYGRVSGVFLLLKPTGITSHDLVDGVRRILRTKKVGHAGTLDPFASGLVLVLVGKYTKYAEAIIQEDKEYLAKIVFGIQSLTQDPEGIIIKNQEVIFNNELEIKIKEIINNFPKSYKQRVPVFSSVKVNGYKLRVLAHSAKEIIFPSESEVTFIISQDPKPAKEITLNLPIKEVKIYNLELLEAGKIAELTINQQLIKGNYSYCNVRVNCSKGTYIRQLAEDLGSKLGLPAFLLELERSKIGNYTLKQGINLTDLQQISDALVNGNKV